MWVANLPQRIRSIRAEHGLTLAELGRRLGVSEGTVCRWESGRQSIRPARLARLNERYPMEERAEHETH